MRDIASKKYQVWVTSYALDGNDPASKHDPGYKLIGTFDTIDEAVSEYDKQQSYDPVITKVVTWRADITDTTEATQ